MIAQKSRKTKPEPTPEIPETPETPETTPETMPEPSQKRDKQVTVKFSENEMERLKTAAGKARRPVANLIYSLTMEHVENSENNSEG